MKEFTLADLFGGNVASDSTGITIKYADIEAISGLPSGFDKTDVANSSAADLLRALLTMIGANIAESGAVAEEPDVQMAIGAVGRVKVVYNTPTTQTGAGNSMKQQFVVSIVNRVGAKIIARGIET